MAYCSKCGAYIPEGQEKCLACEYDPTEDTKQAEQTAAQTEYYTNANDELRKKLEEHERLRKEFDESQKYQQKMEEERRKQQEQAKAWAEQEKQRREAEKRQTEWKQYNAAQSKTTAYTPSRSNSWSKSRLMSVLSYISGLFVIPLIFAKEDRAAMFHAKQGLRLFIFGLVCHLVTWLPLVGKLIEIGRIYLAIRGTINAINDREEPLPYIGRIGM